MRSLTYKVISFLAGFILLNYLCLGFMLVLWHEVPDTGVWMNGGVRKVMLAWAILNWVSPFDTLGFLRKLGSAIATSFAPLTSHNPTGVGLQASPDIGLQQRAASAVSKVMYRLSGFGLVYLCCLVPLTVIDYLWPDIGLLGRYKGAEVLLLAASLASCLNGDWFKFIDRWVGALEDDHPASRSAEDKAV